LKNTALLKSCVNPGSVSPRRGALHASHRKPEIRYRLVVSALQVHDQDRWSSKAVVRGATNSSGCRFSDTRDDSGIGRLAGKLAPVILWAYVSIYISMIYSKFVYSMKFILINL